jgi:hypothetical protein
MTAHNTVTGYTFCCSRLNPPALMKSEHVNPSIGLLLCISKNCVVAEYALRDSNKPIGMAEYQLVEGTLNQPAEY